MQSRILIIQPGENTLKTRNLNEKPITTFILYLLFTVWYKTILEKSVLIFKYNYILLKLFYINIIWATVQ